MHDDELTIGEAVLSVARSIRLLGNADAATPMGGLEALGAVIKEGDDRIAMSLSDVAEALRDVADAIRESKS